MNFSDAVRTGIDLLRHRTGDVLPVYLATTAVGLVAQTLLFLGVAVAGLSLYGTGRVRRVADAAEGVTLADLQDGEIGPGEEALFDALAGLFTPTVVAVAALTFLVIFAAVVVVRGLTAAAKVHTARALMAGDAPVVAGVRGARADARTFVGFVLLQSALLFGAPVVGAGLAALVDGPAAAAVLVLALLAWLPLLAVFYFGLLFVREAIVVEGIGLLAAVRRNLSFVANNPARAALYVLFEVGALVLVSVLANVLGLLGVSRVGALLSVLFVLPLLGLVKMATYVDGPPPAVGPSAGTDPDATADPTTATAERDPHGSPDEAGSDAADRTLEGSDASDPEAPGGSGSTDRSTGGSTPVGGAAAGQSASAGAESPREGDADEEWDYYPEDVGPDADEGASGEADGPSTSLRADLAAGLRAGWEELLAFGRSNADLIAGALFVFCLGVVGGYALTSPLGIDLGGGEGGGFGLVPIDTAVQLAANNWLVSISQAYAGIALGIPAVINLAFNGVLVGGLGGLGFDPLVFAALILPHGIVEVPALAVSGGLAFQLAARAAAFARGRRSAEAFADDLCRAYRVLVGLLPVFVLAGFIEAFLTPVVGDAVRAAIGA